MTHFRKLRALLHNDDGATAIEYGLIATGVVLALITTMPRLTGNMKNTYNVILNYFNGTGA